MRGEATLHERDHLLERLDEVLDDATAGHGRMVLVAGDAGAGKSTLVARFAARVASSDRRPRPDVLIGYCDPLTTPRPLGPLLDVACQRGSGLGDLLEGPAEPYVAFARLFERLRASSPTVLVIEDAHWADAATLDMIRFLGRRAALTSAAILVTYRSDEVVGDHALARVLGELATSGGAVSRLEVAPLSLDAVRSLLAEGHEAVDLQRAEHIHRITGGNAFFVGELAASSGLVPTTVSDAIMARLARLDPDVRAVAEVVSVAPRSLEVAHVAALSGVSAAGLGRARAASAVLVSDGTGLRFRHELARLAVLESLDPPRAAALHRSMIDLLVADGSDDHARLAHHAVGAGDAELVGEFATRAAREAMARGAIRQASELFAAALDDGAPLAPADEAGLLVEHTTTLLSLDRVDDARDRADRAVDRARASGDDELLGRALLVRSLARWSAGTSRLAQCDLDEAIDVLTPSGPSGALAEALAANAQRAMVDRLHEPAVHGARQALAMARSLDDTPGTVRSLHALGCAELVTGDADAGERLMLDAHRLAMESGLEAQAGLALGNLGSGLGEVRRYDRARRYLADAADVALRRDADQSLAYIRSWLARIDLEQGHWTDAVERLRGRDWSDGSSASFVNVTALGVIGRVRVRRGDPGADDALERAAELGASGSIQHLWPVTCALAELHWSHGRHATAVELLAPTYERVLATDSAWGQGEVAFWLWMNDGSTDPPATPSTPFRLHIAGDWRAAAEAWRSIGCPYEEALALADGDDEAMLAALDILDALGARPAASRVRAGLRDRQVPSIPRGPRPATREHPAGLTPRQAEVLELVRQGLTNGQIADRLFISTKTAEHHVSAILTKLGARTREEAVELADGW